MDDLQTEQQRPDYIADLWNLSTTLSDEAVDAAETKAKINKFNIDRGEITYGELSINLRSAREVLRDAIEKQKLIQLPITIQKELLSNLQAINRSLQGLMNNSDEIVNLNNAVEGLNTSIWKYGLHNLSDQVLGYQTKLNQLKQQDVQARKLLEVLEQGRITAADLTVMATGASANIDQIEKSLQNAQTDVASMSALQAQVQGDSAKIQQSAQSAQQAEAQLTQMAATAKTSVAEITPLEASIKGFFSEVDTYRQKIAASTDEASKFLTEASTSLKKSIGNAETIITTEIDRLKAAAKASIDDQALMLSAQINSHKTTFSDLVTEFNLNEVNRIKVTTDASDAQLAENKVAHEAFVKHAELKLVDLESGLKTRSEETIATNKRDVDAIIAELAQMKESVKQQLAQATGFGQFGAFQSRQNTIASGKLRWEIAIGSLVTVVFLLTAYIAAHTQQGDLHSASFWIKLSMNIPLGFLISFCTLQYNRERRLEEEYAFKASISISLNPYRELIYSIIEKDGNLKDGTYTQFVVDSVRNVFTSPTEKIFDSPKKFEGVSEKSLKATAELIGTAVKAAK
ncbi:MAG: hypothetical protein ABI380_15205 [Edaphobacter sp.]